MDKQLLNALDNLSVGLEALAEALKQKNAQSSTATALQSGNFEKSLESITVELKSIKKDTQEILKNQQTIIALQRKKDADKKTGEFEDAGGGKKESQIKKGVTTILLIAVAVLAIGLAFKLVGKIDFLSVIGLSAAIWVMSLAFERIAKLKMTIKEAAIASISMVMMALAVTLSSFILSKVSKVGFTQLLTAGAIIGMFALAAPRLIQMMEALGKMGIMQLIKGVIALPIVLVAVSIGITVSSWILSRISPMTFSQGITAILISVVFVAISFGLNKIVRAVRRVTNPAMTAVGLILLLPAVSLSITASSWILKKITPISFSQALTAIMIGAMFSVISFGMEKIVKSVGKIQKWSDVLKLPAFLTLISLAIAASAFIFYKAKTYIDGIGFLTTLRILLLGVTVAAIAVIASFALKIMGNVSWKTVLQVPTLFTLMALGIALSAFVLAKAKSSLDKLTFGTIFRILILGAALAIVTIIVAFTAKIMGNIPWSQVVKIPVFYTLIAVAIAASAFILAKSRSSFDKMSFGMLLKIAVFGVAVAIAVAAMGLVVKLFKMLGIGVKDAIKGGIAIVAIAAVIMATSLILNLGKYKNYPPLKWVLGVGAALGAFGIAAILLGSQALNPFFYAGLGITLLVAATIIATSHILSAGNYKKFPTLKWLIGTTAAMGVFATAAILLGFNAINPFFYAGLGLLCMVAETIVDVSNILKQGKYNLPGLGTWAASVALLYTLFTPLIITLGAVGAAAAVVEFFGGGNPFEAGRGMLKDIAYSIVDVSKILATGKYTGGPTKKWAEGVSIALGAFAPVYKMLVDSAIFDALGMSGVGPKEFAEGIKTVARGITAAALYFAMNKSAFVNGPPLKWAKGVSAAIGGFAPVFKVMENFPFTGGQKIARAMVHVAHAIVNVAEILSEGGAAGLYKPGTYPSKKWGQGVGESLKAFAPIFDYMFENSSWWGDSDTEVIDNMKYGMVQIAWGIYDVAGAISGAKYDMYPSKKWAEGVETAVHKFFDIMYYLSTEKGIGAGEFARRAKTLSEAAWSMASVANAFYWNRKSFNYVLPKKWISSNASNIIGFAKLALYLDKLLVTEKTVTSTSSGLFGSSSSSKTVRERRDLGLVKDIAFQMSSVAYILWRNKKYFTGTTSIKSWGKSIIGMNGIIAQYARLVRYLELSGPKGLLGSISKSIFSDPVIDAATKLVRVAKILSGGKSLFAMKIDPFFMRKVGQNIVDFNFVVKKLAEAEGNKGFLQKMGEAGSSMFGTDPISQIARRMITLAKGYDAMATALLKLGKALKVLNIKSLQQLGSITKGFTGQGPMPSEVRTERPQRYGRMYGEDQEGEPIKKKKREKQLSPLEDRKNQILYVSQQLEKVVKLLQSIDRSTSTIDEFIAIQTKNKVMSPPELKT